MFVMLSEKFPILVWKKTFMGIAKQIRPAEEKTVILKK